MLSTAGGSSGGGSDPSMSAFRQAPNAVKRILLAAHEQQSLDDDGAYTLQQYITSWLTKRQLDPKPLLTVYTRFLGTEDLCKVVTKEMLDAIETFRQTHEPKPATVELSSRRMEAEFKEDPCEYKIEEIPGVQQNLLTGGVVATKITVKWCRSVLYFLLRNNSVELLEKFKLHLENLFGSTIFERIVTDGVAKRFAELQQKARTGQISKELGDGTPEAADLHRLMTSLTWSQVPGRTGQEPDEGLSVQTVLWARSKLTASAEHRLSPRGLLVRLRNMFGDQEMRRVLTPEVVEYMKRVIARNGLEPVPLIDEILTSTTGKQGVSNQLQELAFYTQAKKIMGSDSTAAVSSSSTRGSRGRGRGNGRPRGTAHAQTNYSNYASSIQPADNDNYSYSAPYATATNTTPLGGSAEYTRRGVTASTPSPFKRGRGNARSYTTGGPYTAPTSQPGPPPDLTWKKASPERELKPVAVDNSARRDAAGHKEDPTEYTVEEIPGVLKDEKTGEYVATNSAIRWARSVMYVVHRTGDRAKVESFKQHLINLFGDTIIDRVINDHLAKRYADILESSAGDNVADGAESAEKLRQLMTSLSWSDVSGQTGNEASEGLSMPTIFWTRSKLKAVVAHKMNPTPFLSRLRDLFGETELKRILTATFVGSLKKQMVTNKIEAVPLLDELAPPEADASAAAKDSGPQVEVRGTLDVLRSCASAADAPLRTFCQPPVSSTVAAVQSAMGRPPPAIHKTYAPSAPQSRVAPSTNTMARHTAAPAAAKQTRQWFPDQVERQIEQFRVPAGLDFSMRNDNDGQQQQLKNIGAEMGARRGTDAFKADPSQYTVNEIPGAMLDEQTGRTVASGATIRWARSVMFVIHRQGDRQLIDKFKRHLQNLFGANILQRVINDHLEKRYADVFEKAATGANDFASLSEEGKRLHRVMNSLTWSQLPGHTGSESRDGLSDATVTWTRVTLQAIIAEKMDPNPLLIRTRSMFGVQQMNRVLAGGFAANLKRQLAARNFTSAIRTVDDILNLTSVSSAVEKAKVGLSMFRTASGEGQKRAAPSSSDTYAVSAKWGRHYEGSSSQQYHQYGQ